MSVVTVRWLRPGDWLVAGLGLALVIGLIARPHPGAGRIVVRQAGQIWLDTDTRLNRRVQVPGPLGVTDIEIRNGRVRVVADPSPRQLCVRKGWLAPGEMAVCLPNRVSVEWGVTRYDSLNY